MKILALVTDAFGGYGGIALYNRDFLTALCHYKGVEKVVVNPRNMPNVPEPLPDKLVNITAGLGGICSYLSTVTKTYFDSDEFNLIVCGHINLLPLAWFLGKILGIPIILEIYGIDAWEPTSRKLSNWIVGSIPCVISISECTRQRFLTWSKINPECCVLLPNAIHTERYGVKPKSKKLLDKYALANKVILLTFGRLVSHERAKGFDEVLNILPELVVDIPNIMYVIAGDGCYGAELKHKVNELQLEDKVIFTGMVKEEEKADIYRLADVYIMPSRGEGFGFVFLEAMACGIPVVASKQDGGREAVRNGELGQIVDPDNPQEIKLAIMRALKSPRQIPQGLDYFSFDNFTHRLHGIIDKVIEKTNG